MVCLSRVFFSDTTNKFYKAPTDDEVVTAIEFCLRTKYETLINVFHFHNLQPRRTCFDGLSFFRWADAEIDWNGIEPVFN